MKPIKATHCDLCDDGLRLTFDDGQTFLFSHAFLFSTRFTHANPQLLEESAEEKQSLDFLKPIADRG